MNLPNKISLTRVLFIPVLIAFYLIDFTYGKLIATLLFILLACTDFIDGHIARSRNMVTDLGKFLDESADKLLNTSVLLLLVADGTIPAPFGVISAIIIIARDQIVGFVRRFAMKSDRVIPANKMGKIKTICQDIAFPLLMFMAFNNSVMWIYGTGMTVYQIITFSLFGIAVLLTIISGIVYFMTYKDLLKG